MKIIQPKSDSKAFEDKLLELSELIKKLEKSQEGKLIRPCPNCHSLCSCSSSPVCSCDCSANCPKAPTQLSSEEGRYPIEKMVLPLVYALRQISVCNPCWSCEGHLNEKQQLNKIPQVWFHSSSMCLIRLMDECLGVFKAKKLLNYTWQISVSFSGRECIDNGFTLKPDLNIESEIQLDLLHHDLANIAEHLGEQLLINSRRYQKSLLKMKTNLLDKVI